MIINELSVAPFNIDAVSSISCIKVETPRSWKEQNAEQSNLYHKEEIFSNLFMTIGVYLYLEPRTFEHLYNKHYTCKTWTGLE